MNDPKKKFTEEERQLMEETELFMQEVYRDPDVADAEPPDELYDKVLAEIRVREGIRQKSLEDKLKEGEQELERLKRVYRQRLRMQRYAVVASVLILVMAFGVTTIGGPEKIFEMVKSTFGGRDQIHVDSEEISKTEGLDEEEAYQKIERDFGFVPVALYYLPDGTEFVEAEIGKEIQLINIIYERKEDTKIIYTMRPNYRASSHGKDVEDDFVEDYIEENEYTTIYTKKYLVDGKEERWTVQFEYQDVSYTMTVMNTSKIEVDKIIKNLYFV